jgi:hypothetical protein
MKFIDRVKETTATTGTGDFVLAGAVAGFQSFAGYAVGERVPYCAALGAEWEVGIGTKAASSITRTTVTASSNGGALVNFSAGTKELYVNAGASFLSSVSQTSVAAFSQAIPLSVPGATYMAPYTVTGPLTFTAMAGAVQGALAYLRLTADGTNAPNFSAFKEWGGSSGYDNRVGIVNQMQFFFDGTDLFYTASQAVGAVPVAPSATGVTMTGPTGGVVSTASTNFTIGVTPVGGTITGTVTVTPSDGGNGGTFAPTTVSLTSAQPTATFTYTPASTGAKTISVTNNGGLTNPANITYTATAAATAPAQMAAPTATAGDASASVTLVAPSNGGSAITGYTVTSIPAGGVDGAAGTTALTRTITGLTNGTAYTFTATATNAVDTSAASPASNSVTPAAAAAAIRLSPRSADLTESASAPWVYSGTGATYGGAIGGIATLGLQSGLDGSLSQTFTGHTAGSTSAEIMLGLQSGTSVVAFTSLPYAFYTEFSQSKYTPFTSGTRNTPTNAVSPLNGDIMRLRRSGSSLIAEVAREATPTTFTTIYTWTGVPTGVMRYQSVVGTAAGTVANLSGVGLA